MGKSLYDMIASMGGKTHTRIYDICGGNGYNSTYATELSDEVCSNVLEVNGSGRIVAILPMLTVNASMDGQIKVFIDGKKVISGVAFWYNARIYPFLYGGNEMSNLFGNYSGNANSGFYIPEFNISYSVYNGTYKTPYRSSYNTFITTNNPNVYDDSNGSKEFTFKESFKILASQAGGTSYVDSAKIMVIYDLED